MRQRLAAAAGPPASSVANPLEGNSQLIDLTQEPQKERAASAGSALVRTLSGGRAQSERTLGQRVFQWVLIAPTIINWLGIMAARFLSQAEVVDSENISHFVPRSRNFNFTFLCAPPISPRGALAFRTD